MFIVVREYMICRHTVQQAILLGEKDIPNNFSLTFSMYIAVLSGGKDAADNLSITLLMYS